MIIIVVLKTEAVYIYSLENNYNCCVSTIINNCKYQYYLVGKSIIFKRTFIMFYYYVYYWITKP